MSGFRREDVERLRHEMWDDVVDEPRVATPESVEERASDRNQDAASDLERESREFFYVHDGRVSKVTGWICEGTPGYWWCPEVGVSAGEGYSLFRDRVDAYEKAYASARRALDTALANIRRIEEERWA